MKCWKSTCLVFNKTAYALIVFLISFMGSSFVTPSHAQAATNLFALNASVGINGYYDKNHLVPVTVRITNSGPARRGDLEVRLAASVTTASTAEQDGTLRYPINIAANGVTKMMIVVPGTVVASSKSIELVVGGSTVDETTLSGNSLGRVALVAVVSNNLQATQFLAGSSDPLHQEPVLAERIAPTELPASADWFDAITAVTISPKVLRELTTTQRDALQSWVRLGGLLIVTGPTPKITGWTGELPLGETAGHYTSDAPLLNFTGSYAAISENHIESFAAALTRKTSTKVWAGTEDDPLIANSYYGRGTIVQTAFSPLDSHLLSWSGNATLWSTVFQRGLAASVNSLPSLTGSSGALALTSSSDALSPMRVPPLKFWGPLFALYVIVIGPLLFFLLRRWRKEPMAWWILPVVSLITTGMIYGFGAIQRPHGVLSETVGMMELTGNGSAEVYGVTGFTSPYVTDARLDTNGATFALPLSPPQARESGSATSYISRQASAEFQGVGRWNLRYLYSQGTVSGQGHVAVKIDDTLGTVTGTIVNKTEFTLHDVAILWKGKIYELGDLKPDASVNVTTKTKYRAIRGNWLSEYGQYNGDITHGLGRAIGSYLASTDAASQLPQGRAMIVATSASDTPGDDTVRGLPTVSTAQKIISNEQLVLVRQFAQVKIVEPSQLPGQSIGTSPLHFGYPTP